jgi:hypothetical protein
MARPPQTPAAKKTAAKRPARPATPKPARPKGLAHARWLGDFPDLSAAEKRLVECCGRGEPWMPEGWDGKRPEAASAANSIRAELIRFLVLGGDAEHPVHENGVTAGGAWVAGLLDLHQCDAKVRLDLRSCQFDTVPVLLTARLPELVLAGSKMLGLFADGIKVTGSVYLRNGFSATGGVRLLGAEIGGNLECDGSTFANADGFALYADNMKVRGAVFMRDGFSATGGVRLLGAEIGGNLECDRSIFTNAGGFSLYADNMKVTGAVFLRDGFSAMGEVCLSGVKIGGDLACDAGTFTNPGGPALSAERSKVGGGVFLRHGFAVTGEVRLLGAEIGGDLECTRCTFTQANRIALNADGITVRGALFLREAQVDGAICLASARIDTLIDDETGWAAGGHVLDGLRYDRIVGPTDAASRIRWLERQRADHLDSRDWRPQPWEHLIETLSQMGQRTVAIQIEIAKQDRMRRAGRVGGPVEQFLHWLYGFVMGYGYRPLRLFQWMLITSLACSFFFSVGADYGYIGPTTPLLNSPEIAAQVEAECGHRFELDKTPWTRCPAMPAEYTTFQPFLYSLDLILPLVDLQQEADWAPIVEAPDRTLPFGIFLRWLMWFEILFGWAMSLMLVAVLGKLVNKD